jgi:hypothetical protein
MPHTSFQLYFAVGAPDFPEQFPVTQHHINYKTTVKLYAIP